MATIATDAKYVDRDPRNALEAARQCTNAINPEEHVVDPLVTPRRVEDDACKDSDG